MGRERKCSAGVSGGAVSGRGRGAALRAGDRRGDARVPRREGARRAGSAPRRPSGRQVVKEGRENCQRHRARPRGVTAGPERRDRVNTWAIVFLGVIAVATLATAIVQVGCSSPPAPRAADRPVRRRRRARGQADPRPPQLVSRDASRAAASPSRRSNASMRCHGCRRENRSDDHDHSLPHRQAGARGPRVDDGHPRDDGGDPGVPAPSRPPARRGRRPVHLAHFAAAS